LVGQHRPIERLPKVAVVDSKCEVPGQLALEVIARRNTAQVDDDFSRLATPGLRQPESTHLASQPQNPCHGQADPEREAARNGDS
jgi:hypothetical protein